MGFVQGVTSGGKHSVAFGHDEILMARRRAAEETVAKAQRVFFAQAQGDIRGVCEDTGYAAYVNGIRFV